jgi:hypothetical protein
MFDYFLNSKVAAQDLIALQAGNWTDASGDLGYGSALIRTSFAPIQAVAGSVPGLAREMAGADCKPPNNWDVSRAGAVMTEQANGLSI